MSSTQTAIISKATLADVPDLNLLVNKAYRGESSAKGWTTESHLLDGLRIDEATLTEYMEDADTVILKYADGDGIQACVYLKTEPRGLYLGMLTVNPELQNSGIGKMLLESADNYAKEKGITHLWMTVISSRYELIAYYERKGFKLTGEMKPFPTDAKFGIQKQPLELAVLEKQLN